jgi:hypothetical protein
VEMRRVSKIDIRENWVLKPGRNEGNLTSSSAIFLDSDSAGRVSNEIGSYEAPGAEE